MLFEMFEDKAVKPFEMSIEAIEGEKAKRHGFHLGTDERLARRIVEDTFAAREKHGLPVVTIALMRGPRIVDVFYGSNWQNDEVY